MATINITTLDSIRTALSSYALTVTRKQRFQTARTRCTLTTSDQVRTYVRRADDAVSGQHDYCPGYWLHTHIDRPHAITI